MKKFIIVFVCVVLSVFFSAAVYAETHYQITSYGNLQLVTKTADSWGKTKVSYGLRVKGIEVCEVAYRVINYVPELKLLLLSDKNGSYDELKVFSTETGECLYYYPSVACILNMQKSDTQLKIKFGRSKTIYEEETFVRKNGQTKLVNKKRNYQVEIPKN